MYSEKFATAVKVAGKVLRENGETVALPFGSEYSLYFKNMNSLRALVRVQIDGVDATGGTSLIVPANGSVDLERFIKNGNFSSGNRFKFIERTKKIEGGPRGVKIEDGLIRVEFEFEQQPAKIEPYPHNWYVSKTYYSAGSDTLLRGLSTNSSPHLGQSYSTSATFDESDGGAVLSAASSTSGALRSGALSASSCRVEEIAQPQNASQAFMNQVNEVGITVPGSVSDQKFVTGAWFATDGQKHVMILKLLGQVGEQLVQEPITVKAKPTCTTCGTVNKANAKFCRECGTGLVLV